MRCKRKYIHFRKVFPKKFSQNNFSACLTISQHLWENRIEKTYVHLSLIQKNWGRSKIYEKKLKWKNSLKAQITFYLKIIVNIFRIYYIALYHGTKISYSALFACNLEFTDIIVIITTAIKVRRLFLYSTNMNRTISN